VTGTGVTGTGVTGTGVTGTGAPPTAGLGAAGLGPPRGARRRAWRQYLVAFALYQALGMGTWWHLVAGGVTTTVPAGSADPGEEVWFLAWLPHALGTAANPFLSHAIFAPAGVNLLSNTSIDLLGLLLSPVTATAGAVASLDIASILAPALSALAAFALCRRYVSWQPAAFVGGLCYGFGPFLATDLRYGHLDLTWLVFPPLIFIALDELLVRQRRRPLPTGAVLGVLVVAQFFVSTELLTITVLTGAVALALAALRRPRSVAAHLRAAGAGLALAVGIPAAVLAYPVWVVVAGPRHFEGPVWPDVGRIASSVAAAVQPHAELAGVAFVSGGNGSYLGVTLLVVLAAGAVAFWRSTALRLAVALMVVCFVASLGYDLHVDRTDLHVTMPLAVLGHVPLLDSVIPERFAAMTDLFAGVALAIVVDHVRRASWPARSGRTTGARAVLAAATAVVALVPLGLLPPWPYATSSVVQPAVLRSHAVDAAVHGAASAVHGPPIVAVYPDAAGAVSDQMVWQAQDGFSFALADGYAIVPGTAQHATESPRLDALWLVFAAASLGRLPLSTSRTTLRSIRAALAGGRVRDVVVLPGAVGSVAVRHVLEAALGRPSRRVDGAVLWVLPGS
jgi:hypothetical protein